MSGRRFGRIGRLAAVVAMCLTLTACDLDLFLDLFFPVDLEQAEDPAEKAAAAADDESKKLREADRAVDEALAEKDPEKLDKAVDLRPRDPRYLMYRAFVNAILGTNRTSRVTDIDRALALIKADSKGQSESDTKRKTNELTIDVAGRVLNSFDGDPLTADSHRGLARSYCNQLANYRRDFGSSVRGSLYLQFADTSRC